MQDLIRDFVVETVESLDALDAELLRFEREPDNQAILSQIYRLLHTIKGACGFLDLGRLERLAHSAEELINRFRDGRAAMRDEVTLVLMTLDRIRGIVVHVGETGREPDGVDHELIALLAACAARGAAAPVIGGSDADHLSSDDIDRLFAMDEGSAVVPDEPQLVRRNVRVSVERLDHLMNMVSELVLVRNQLLDLARRDTAGHYKLPLQRLSYITGELQDGVMRTRMQPIQGAWSKVSRMVRDLSDELGKPIRVELAGGSTEIDRQILEVIKDCLIHMIRNAADHGIESADERRAAGKPAEGTIRLRAAQEGSQIVFTVEDDGRGLNLDRIRARVLALGLSTEERLQKMSEQDIARFVFAPGFSTAAAITNVSGRGIGLDAVRNGIEQVGGLADVISRPGQGTSIILRLPLTLAVAGVLVVEAAGQTYALPQVTIAELVRASEGSDVRFERLGDSIALRMRDCLLPMVDLAAILTGGRSESIGSGLVAVCEVGRLRFGMAVDAIHQTEEIVVKPLSARLRHIPYFSGATILGDGSVILILEATGFADLVGSVAGATAEPGEPARVAPPASNATTLLVFAAGEGPLKAVPMALISRLEEIEVSCIQQVGAHRLVTYQGGLMPLLPADDTLIPKAAGLQPVLVFQHGGRSAGVMVDEILDVTEAELVLDLNSTMPGTVGTALIGGRMMAILDVAALFVRISAAAPVTGGGRQQVALYEPSEFFRALLVPVIEGAGYAVRPVSSPAEVVEVARAAACDAVVVDLDSRDGHDLAHTLAASRPEASLRVIGLVTRRSASLMQEAEALGLAALVGKFDRRGLLAELAFAPEQDGAVA